jgi:single-strand selective monofunctional uracil DNA glycosylase
MSTSSTSGASAALIEISRELRDACDRLTFGGPVEYVYDPLSYASVPHERYLERWGAAAPREILMLGMNPGPFGMAQTGVPFGDVAMVRDFLGVEGPVARPARVHPQRPIEGFACKRSEVSGTRLWGWAKSRFGSPEQFFARFFVVNWCPLVFMEESGKNRTPDKLAPAERAALFPICDHALVRIVETLRPRLVVGVGAFAEQRARTALAGTSVTTGCVLHPSPASPAANRDWAGLVDAQLAAMGVAPPPRSGPS